MRSTSAFFLVSLLVAACGGGSDGSTITVVDSAGSGSGSDSGSGSGACTAAATYTAALTDSNGSAQTDGSGFDDTALENNTGHVIQGGGALNADAAPDGLTIELWAGYGAFTGSDITAKSVTISGDETDYYSCGACLLVDTDVSDDGQGGVNIVDSYMAQSGTLMLTSVSGTLSGSLSNVVLAHATLDDEAQTTTVVGDCSTTINGTFSLPIEAASSARAATKPGAPVRLHLRRVRNR